MVPEAFLEQVPVQCSEVILNLCQVVLGGVDDSLVKRGSLDNACSFILLHEFRIVVMNARARKCGWREVCVRER